MIAIRNDLPRFTPEKEKIFIVPDAAVFTWEQIPRDDKGKVANIFALAPDWTIEILS